MRRAAPYACVCLAALAFALAVHVHAVFAWFVGAPLAFTLAERGLRSGALFGALFGGLAILGAHATWASFAVGSYFHLPVPTAALGVVVAFSILGTALGAVFGMLASSALAVGVVAAPLVFGCAWVLWESVVTATLPYYPWASLAVTQARYVDVLQIAAWVGHAGVSFVVAATGAALGLAAAAPSARRGAVLLLLGFSIALLVVATGWWRLARESTPPANERSCSLRAIDAVIASGMLPRDEVLARYAAATEAVLEPRPDAVVWPESALPGAPEVDASLGRWLRSRAAEWGVVLVAGGPRIAWTGRWQPKVFNSVYRIAAGEPLQHYDKRRLVPFAEYWPAVGLSRPTWLETEETEPGNREVLFSVGSCRLGVLVCFEGERADAARSLVREGADALLVLSNDAHLSPAASRLEIAQLQLRAAETGVEVVRVANRGISAHIDRHGRILEATSAAAFLARLAAPNSAAPAVRWARLFRLLCHGVALGALARALVRQRQN